MEKLYYLASPYSHPDAWMREVRFRAVARVAGALRRDRGLATFCPITHSHPITEWGAVPNDFDFWAPWDKLFDPLCYGLIVCQLPGWDQSVGISEEVKLFRNAGKPVEDLDPKRWFTSPEWAMLEAGAV